MADLYLLQPPIAAVLSPRRRFSPEVAMLKSFPLLLVAIIVYNALVFGGAAIAGTDANAFLARSVSFTMFSDDVWRFTLGDLIVLMSLCLLFIEIVKSTRTSAKQVLNHAMSMLTFVIGLTEFLVLKGFSTTTFFFVVVMVFFDIVAGFTISIVGARRDLDTTGGLIGTNLRRTHSA
jgi:hypothetical protein